MHRILRYLTRSSVALAVLFVAGCAGQQDPDLVVFFPGDTIKIGAGSSLTGPLEGPGQDILNGIQLATAEFNEISTLEDFEIELVVADDGCAPEGAVQVATEFTRDPQIVAVIGHVCSGATGAAAEIYQQARIPMVSSSSTSPGLTTLGYDVLNRTAWNDNIQGESSARFAIEVLSVERAAVLHDGDAYGEGLAEVFRNEFEALGGTVTRYEQIDVNTASFHTLLQDIAAEDAQMIFYGGYDDQASLMVSQLREINLDNIIFFSDDGTYNQEFLDEAGVAAEGVYASFAAPPSGVAEALNAVFDDRYFEMFGQEPDSLGPFHAHAYDAAMIIFDAIERTAEQRGPRLIISRQRLIQAIRATQVHRGLTGTLSCNANGECGATGQVVVVQVTNGEWVEVEDN